MRTPLIAGNWKMYKTGPQAAETAGRLAERVAGADHAEVMIAPPFTALVPVAAAVAGSRIQLGGQNLHWENEGAFTGEVSAGMLAAAGCRYVIIGHSERRQYFGETDDSVNRKITAAVDGGLSPVVCVGESEDQREDGLTFSVLDKQLDNGLQGLALEVLDRLVLAYEPVWAIGTGKTATSDQAQEVHAHLRSWVRSRYGDGAADAMRILYGGSVKPKNIAELMAMTDIDGALVGGASLDADTFSQIVFYNKG